jgi:hypothetical protein
MIIEACAIYDLVADQQVPNQWANDLKLLITLASINSASESPKLFQKFLKRKLTDNDLTHVIKVGHDIFLSEIYTSKAQSFPGRMLTEAMKQAFI